jgi:hypothetical protein
MWQSVRQRDRHVVARQVRQRRFADEEVVSVVLGRHVARLSPLGHEHINVLGRYSFAPADGIAGGELRPLNQPNDHGDLAAGAA